jgi:hypothetical protein
MARETPGFFTMPRKKQGGGACDSPVQVRPPGQLRINQL